MPSVKFMTDRILKTFYVYVYLFNCVASKISDSLHIPLYWTKYYIGATLLADSSLEDLNLSTKVLILKHVIISTYMFQIKPQILSISFVVENIRFGYVGVYCLTYTHFSIICLTAHS